MRSHHWFANHAQRRDSLPIIRSDPLKAYRGLRLTLQVISKLSLNDVLQYEAEKEAQLLFSVEFLAQ